MTLSNCLVFRATGPFKNLCRSAASAKIRRLAFLLGIVLSNTTSITCAQAVREFGDVTMADFMPTPYDSISSSVILFDKCVRAGSITTLLQRHIRVKIISREALSYWGDIRLAGVFTRDKRVKAATYFLEEGKIVAHVVDKNAFLKDPRSPYEKILSLTNMKEGCIIELSYEAHASNFTLPYWPIQAEVPVLWSEFLLAARTKPAYVVRGGFEPVSFEENYKGKFYRWVFENIPPFVPEPLMPDPVNYLGRLEFVHPANSWDAVGEQYQKDIRLWQANHHYEIHRLKPNKLIEDITDSLEKVIAICDYVRQKHKWTGHFNFLPNFYGVSLFRAAKGNSADLNVLLYSLLEMAGLDVHPVILSTRSNGIPHKSLPSATYFDYVICLVTVEGKDYFLDVTQKRLPFNILPQYCSNLEGLIIGKNGVSWTTTEAGFQEKISQNVWLSVGSDQHLNARVTTVTHGYGALIEQAKFEESGELLYQHDSKPSPLWSIDSVRLSGMLNPGSPTTVTHYGKMPAALGTNAGKIYINPYFLLSPENPFQGNRRNLPVDFVSRREERLLVTVEIPEGYVVDQLPRSQLIATSDRSIVSTFKISADARLVNVLYLFELKTTWFEHDDFANLREYFDRILAAMNDMIVLSKTEEKVPSASN